MNFTTNEILNAVSQIFRGRLTQVKMGGVTDPEAYHSQILEISALTFLTHPDSIFYLSHIVSNVLSSKVSQEVSILEDMLVGIDNLKRVGASVGGSGNLSNASTALLELDGAASVGGRPELARFIKNIDKFTEGLRKNTVSKFRDLAMPREEARNILLRNMAALERVHAEVLEIIVNLRDLLSNYNDLDMPTKVSKSSMANIRALLDQMADYIESEDEVVTIAESRAYLLNSLASKAAVKLISTFSAPTAPKYRGPRNSIPANSHGYYGEVVGNGIPPSVITTPGPWELPISGDLEFRVEEGGAVKTVALTEVVGATLNSRNREDFETSSEHHNVHVVVDPNTYKLTATGVGSTTSVGVSELLTNLGFKHRGAPIRFYWSGMPLSDSHPRYVTTNTLLRTITTTPSWDSATRILTVVSAPGFFQVATPGMTVEDASGNVFEILRKVDDDNAEIDPRGLTPDTSLGVVSLYGQYVTPMMLYFSPALSMAPPVGAEVYLGPTVKTGKIASGTRTAAQVVSDLSTEDPANTDADPAHVGSPLHMHVGVAEMPSDPGRVSLSIRSRADSFMQISRNFPKVSASSAAPHSNLGLSAHTVLGFNEGESDSDYLLTPSELINAVHAEAPEVTVEVVREDVHQGTLRTIVGTGNVEDTSTNFATLEVAEGFQIEVLGGQSSGVYRVEDVPSPSVLELRGASFEYTEEGVRYNVFTERVKISLLDSGPGSYLEVISSPIEIIPATSQTSYRGSISSFRAVSKKGNTLEFSGVFPGDFLKVAGLVEAEIESVDGDILTLARGLASNVTGVQFEVNGGAARDYNSLSARLQEYTTSRVLLRKNKFDEGVDYIDAALTGAISTGQAFASNLNTARQAVGDLLSILTDVYPRSGEYEASVTPATTTLAQILRGHTAERATSLDNFIEDLITRKYDRAVSLLKKGDIVEFFNTTEGTASFGGALVEAGKKAVGDMPSPPLSEYEVDLGTYSPVGYTEGPDPDEDFDDTFYEEEYDL